MSLPTHVAYGGRTQPDPARVALCKPCLDEGRPAWRDPRESGEWALCVTHLITALDNTTQTNPASDGVTV